METTALFDELTSSVTNFNTTEHNGDLLTTLTTNTISIYENTTNVTNFNTTGTGEEVVVYPIWPRYLGISLIVSFIVFTFVNSLLTAYWYHDDGPKKEEERKKKEADKKKRQKNRRHNKGQRKKRQSTRMEENKCSWPVQEEEKQQEIPELDLNGVSHKRSGEKYGLVANDAHDDDVNKKRVGASVTIDVKKCGSSKASSQPLLSDNKKRNPNFYQRGDEDAYAYHALKVSPNSYNDADKKIIE